MHQGYAGDAERAPQTRLPQRSPRGARSRDLIASAARHLLAEHGYQRFNFDLIAEHTGLAKTTIYRWWPTKADLVLDLLEREFHQDALPQDLGPRLEVLFSPLGFPELARVLPALALDVADDRTRQGRLHGLFAQLSGLADSPSAGPHAALDAATRYIEHYCGTRIFRALLGTPDMPSAPTETPVEQLSALDDGQRTGRLGPIHKAAEVDTQGDRPVR